MGGSRSQAAMKFAFSTIVCPQWSIAETVARAREFGFDGVEIALDRPEALGDPRTTSDQFAAAVAIPAIATPLFATGGTDDTRTADQLRRFIDLAASLACPVVKMRDIRAARTCGIGQAGTLLARFLRAVVDHAAQRKVKLAIENAITLRTALPLWTMLEQVNRPEAVAACLDIGHAAGDEGPAVSVPTLASHLATVDVSGWTPDQEGEPRIKQLLVRLRGIGYRGFVTFESPLPDPATGLPAVLKKFKDFSTQAPPPKAHPAAAKAAGPAKPPPAAKPEAKAPPKVEPATA